MEEEQITQYPNQDNSVTVTLSNILQTELINFKISKNRDDIEYELKISHLKESWIIKRTLREIRNYIKDLQASKYIFISHNSLNNLNANNIKETNQTVMDLLRYINYRTDILSNTLTHIFFDFVSKDYIIKEINTSTITQLFYLSLDNTDMTLSDFDYDPETGIFIATLEDISFFSRIGRFWSLIDYEILGNLFVFQRVYDKNNQPYFNKLVVKNFDARVSKVVLAAASKRIIVGLENGSIMIFNINILPNLKEDHVNVINITISEGISFRHFSERITGLAAMSDAFIAVSKDNKIMIIETFNRNEVLFSASIKKRIEGKGYANNIVYVESQKRLYLSTITDVFLIYEVKQSPKFDNNDLSPEYKLEFVLEIKCENYIKNFFVMNNSIFIGLENQIIFYNFTTKTNSFNSKSIHLDGSIDKNVSLSSRFSKLGYDNHISSICYFINLKLIVLGLINGVVMVLNSKSLEIVMAKKISEYKISKIVLLEENYIFIVGDSNANIDFCRFGI